MSIYACVSFYEQICCVESTFLLGHVTIYLCFNFVCRIVRVSHFLCVHTCVFSLLLLCEHVCAYACTRMYVHFRWPDDVSSFCLNNRKELLMT